jgi:hypothetical protein
MRYNDVTLLAMRSSLSTGIVLKSRVGRTRHPRRSPAKILALLWRNELEDVTYFWEEERK